jgi:hypothetical protein
MHQLGNGQGVHAWVLAILKDGGFGDVGDAGDGDWVVPFEAHLIREMGGGRARGVRRRLVVSSLLSLPFNVHYCLVFIVSLFWCVSMLICAFPLTLACLPLYDLGMLPGSGPQPRPCTTMDDMMASRI